ncbi:hypothetical protein [Aquiflexum sp.]|uniref:hypothetical protein n=1 Tax=Aquiflexum sp. TaxID=1872584 RepID=UPI00359421B9
MKELLKRKMNLSFFLIALGCSTNGTESESQIRDEIQHQLDRCVLAVATKDIELYMSLIPEDFVIYDQSGEIISREVQKEYTIRDWSIIDRTLSNQYIADSITINGDSAIVFTSQRWERLMFQRDGKTIDTILTTQNHIESWKKTKNGWMNYEVKELGGDIFINGKEYRN